MKEDNNKAGTLTPAGLWGKLGAGGADLRLAFWCLMLAGGFAYVSGVLCGRKMPFTSGAGYGDFFWLLATAPVLYALGPRHTLEPFENGSRALWWNFLGFAFPFFIALHFFYLQRIPNLNYSITPSDLARITPMAAAVFTGTAVLILVLGACHLRMAHKEGILLPYASAFLGSILLIAAITWAIRADYAFHIHHYFLFGFFVPFTRFRNPISLVFQALCAGIYVEGVSEWSMSLLWDLK